MNFDLSELADSMGVATGWRSLAQSGQAQACPCQHAHEEARRPGYLVEPHPEEIFGTDELTAPSVIGDVSAADRGRARH